LADAAFCSKWRKTEDAVGAAELEVAQEILAENRVMETKGKVRDEEGKFEV
jgi:hypothetical protein